MFLSHLGSSVRPLRFPLQLVGCLPLPLPPKPPLPPRLLMGRGGGRLGMYWLMGGILGVGVGGEHATYLITWMMVSSVSAGIETLSMGGCWKFRVP